MRRNMMGIALALGVAGAALSQGADGAIRDVIEDQLTAFQNDDFETAFNYASPMIQGMFRTPERFGEMVRNGYPMVWRPSDVRFTDLTERGGRMIQEVMVTDSAGTMYRVEYEMILTEDGWEINGVRVEKSDQVGV